MLAASTVAYLERTVPLSTSALATAARLAAAHEHEDFVLYENSGHWSFACGPLARLILDRHGARVQGAMSEELAWGSEPLRDVQTLLDRLPVRGWRAYGWSAFELAYAKDGDAGAVGDQQLLHLMIPGAEVRFGPSVALVRATEEAALQRLVELVEGTTPETEAAATPLAVRERGREQYRQSVANAIAEINDGRVQKVICSRVVAVEHEIDLVSTFVVGRRANNPARSFLIRLGGVEVAGFSPEIVVQVTTDGKVTIQPLAGTRVVSPDAAENQRLRAELLSDSKEIYEHAISVQVACDDLRGVCVPESIVVEEFMAIRERGSVQHLASRVSGRLEDGRRAWDAFGAAFPAVTASGVPRSAAYQSIRRIEESERGLYSGSVLTVDDEGAMDAALVLRSVYRQDGRTWLRAGAGIVGQSSPEREFEETCEKLDSVAQFLVPQSA
ncbi:salicylate synthase [Nocardia sp. NPDC051030]|uniref:salicylate synthase n=1 Tax=Nocardia sp. NPDC051030 TaxID=3155162 RepID=UPI0034373259